jgi:hypothetical protein
MARELIYNVRVDGVDDATQDIKNLNNSVNTLDTSLDNTTSSANNASASINNLGTSATNTSNSINNATASKNRFSNAGRRAEGIAKTLSGTLSLTTGVLATFGVESENVQKSLLKVQGAIAISTGIKDLSDGIDDLGINFKSLGKSLLTNPLFLLAAAIIGILAATGNLQKIFKALGDVFGDIFKSLEPLLDIFTELIGDALGPIADLLVGILIPVLKLTTVPLQVLTKVLVALTPVFEVIGDFVQVLSGYLSEFIGFITDSIDAVTSFFGVTSEAKEEIKLTKEELDKYTEALEANKRATELTSNARQREIDLLKATGASVDEIEKKELALIQAKLDSAKADLQLATATITRLKAQGELTKEQQTQFEDLQENVLNLENQLAIKQADINKRRQQEEKAKLEKSKEAYKKYYDDLNKKAQDNLNKQLTFIDDTLNAELNKFKEQFTQGVISAEELDKETKRIEQQSLNLRIQQSEITLQKIRNQEGVYQNLKTEDRIAAETKAEEELEKLRQQALDNEVESRRNVLSKSNETYLSDYEAEYLQQRLNIEKQYVGISDEFEEIAELDKQQRLLELDIRYKKAALDNDKLTQEERVRLETELFELQTQYNQNLENQEDLKRKKIQETLDLQIQGIESIISAGSGIDALGQDILNFFSNLGGSVSNLFQTISDESATTVEKVTAGLQAGLSTLSAIGNIIQQDTRRNIELLEAESEQRIEQIEKQGELGILTEEQVARETERIRQEANKKRLAEERKAFFAQKAIQIGNAVIQTAQAVLAAFAAGAAVPFIGPISTGPTFAGIAAALGAAQIAIIAAQQFPGDGGGSSAGSIGNISSSISSGGSSQIQPAQVSPEFNTFQQQEETFGLQTPVVKAYVVESDITNSIDFSKKINETASLGG